MEYVAIDQTEKEVIDAHLFVEALAMVCLDIAPQDCSFAEAVKYVHLSSYLVCSEWTPPRVQPSSKRNLA